MNRLHFAPLIAIALALPAIAQHDGHAMHRPAASAPTAASMTDGEIRKIDKAAGTITIQHGEIKNLGMPPMTMVFRAGNAALLDKFKAGDKVRFAAEMSAAGALTVTDIRAAKVSP
jgi:Cu/Ag efflux protein CusF